MRQFVVVPCIAGVFLLALGLGNVMAEARNRPNGSRIPALDSRLLPGNPAPFGLDCAVVRHEIDNQFCDLGAIYLIVNEGKITYTFMGTYGTGLTIGDMMNDWGTPIGAEYNPFSVSIYWPDRYAYVYIGNLFSPSSRVGYVTYGKSHRIFGEWRGYANPVK